MIRTHGLTHIALAVRDVDRSSRFYGQVFGAVVESDFDAVAVGQFPRQIRVVLGGKEVVRTTLDFGTVQ